MSDLDTKEQREEAKASSSPWRRRLRISAIAVAALVVLYYAGLGWLFSSKIQNDAFEVEAPGGPEYEVEVLAVSGKEIELSLDSGNAHLDEPGIRGIAWEGGYGQIGDIVSLSDESVVRELLTEPAPPVGQLLDLDGFAFTGDPFVAHGYDYETVSYSSGLGPIDAWLVPGDGDSWAVLVHGKGSPRREALRMLPSLHDAGFDMLIIDYRNDPGAPVDPSGVYGYGTTEWRDLQGAVRYALDAGAEQIVLVGFSMGGGIVSSFMVESDIAGEVDGVILDSPMLDFSATVDLGARHSSVPVVGLPLPQSLTNVSKLLATWRFGVDWRAMDYHGRLADSALYDTPTLVIHGTEDERTPIESSERLAADRPDTVTLEIFENADHVRSWNVDRERYEALVATFVAGLG